ncbi:hypothetical protein TIFTF001_005079 [Ficus carica]|uniref:Uncharacterized protein n=1 Tax=Ficus carica TaxID=3494 RepID=A0AA88CYX0_FICCA|nr:hypothetical protein TIFTF001_005079 [Ficus carica]
MPPTPPSASRPPEVVAFGPRQSPVSYPSLRCRNLATPASHDSPRPLHVLVAVDISPPSMSIIDHVVTLRVHGRWTLLAGGIGVLPPTAVEI